MAVPFAMFDTSSLPLPNLLSPLGKITPNGEDKR